LDSGILKKYEFTPFLAAHFAQEKLDRVNSY